MDRAGAVRLGDDVYLLLTLSDDPQKYPVAGKVAWITPANASGGRTQGIGVGFPNDEKSTQLRLKIEQSLQPLHSGNRHIAPEFTASNLAPRASTHNVRMHWPEVPTLRNPPATHDQRPASAAATRLGRCTRCEVCCLCG